MSQPSTADAGAGSESPYAVLRNRDLRLYLIGRFIASFGQQMLTVAVGWELYERTNAAFALGLVGLAQILPMFLFTLPAGHLADTFNRKHILLATTTLIAISSLCLAAVSVLRAPVEWVYACLFLAGTGRTFMWPSSAAFMPQLVPRHLFPRAVVWSTGSFQLSSVAGPATAGFLLAWWKQAAPIYLINAAAALTCLALTAMVHYRPVALVREPMTLSRLVSGFQFVWQRRIILGTITLDLFAVLLGGATALLPVITKDILHQGPDELGLLQAALPAGSLVCAMIMAHLPPMERTGRILLWSVAGFGLATVGFGLSKVFWLSWVMLFICGFTDNISVLIRHTLVQMLTPDEKRGRVSAVNSLFIGTSNELGGFESGLVAQWMGPVFAVVSGGVGTLGVVVLVAWLWPEIRRYGRLGSPPANPG